MPDCILIGVRHALPGGAAQLERTLEELSPQRILLEGSTSRVQAQETYLRFAEEILAARRVHPEIAALFLEEQRLKHYETKAALAYCRNVGLPLPTYMNDSTESAIEAEIRAMVERSVDNCVRNYTPESMRELFQRSQAVAGLMFGYFKSVIGTADEPSAVRFLPRHSINVGERDVLMEKALRTAIAAEPEQRIAAICGAAHLLVNPQRNSFYCRVQDLHPQRVFLLDAA